MRTRTLGRTGLEVSELSLGGLFLASFAGRFEQAKATVARAIELGIRYVDTAPTYADSEQVLGKILKDIDAPLVLSTKLGGRPSPFDPRDKDGLMQSVETSLQVLHRDHIDILFVHEPDRPGQYDWWSDREALTGPVLEVLDDLKRQGVIAHTGLGGSTAYEMVPLVRTGLFDVLLTAFNYNILFREPAIELLPAAKEQDMAIVIGSPLQQGAFARRYDAEVRQGARWMSKPRREQFRALYGFLDQIDLSLPELAHRFVIGDPDVSCVLTGARSPAELEQNVAWVEKGPLPDEIARRLDEIAAMVPFRPFEEPFGLPMAGDRKGPERAR